MDEEIKKVLDDRLKEMTADLAGVVAARVFAALMREHVSLWPYAARYNLAKHIMGNSR